MPDRNWENRTLFHGDNLAFLRGMNSGTVNLIATDPPFNKNRDFHSTPDSLAAGASFQDRWSWQDDIHEDWLVELQRDEPEVWHVITAAKEVYGGDMAAFLCWLGVRLLEMHRILRDDGSLYLHIDHTAHAWTKALLDAIFGRSNFRNEIVWRRNESGAKGSQHDAGSWGSNVDYLLFYTKSNQVVFEPRIIRDFDEQEIKRRYPKIDENGERYHTKLTAWRQPSMGERPNLCYEFYGIAPPFPSGWRLSRERMEEEYAKGNIVVLDGKLERRSYLKDYLGVSPGNLWTDTELLLGANSLERTGYPTQKPLALYERIIQASSNRGDMVLDPFAGCATTCVAAERLGRQWVGMDIWDRAHEVVLSRLEQENLAVRDKEQKERRWRLTFADITYTTNGPKRTDDGVPATLVLRTPTGKPTRYPPPRKQHDRLLIDIGSFCQGCGRDYTFDPRVLEVDHIRPKSDGGSDAYDNLTLLCPPCNREKRDRITLSGLQDKNRKEGHLQQDNERNIKHGKVARTVRRRRR